MTSTRSFDLMGALMMVFIFSLMPITVIYFVVRFRGRQPSEAGINVPLWEEMLITMICYLQFPIGWLMVAGFLVYKWST